MSRAARFAGLYDELAAIGNLVDDLALALRTGEDTRGDATELGELLVGIDTQEPQSIAEIRLASALSSTRGAFHRWTELGKRLLAGAVGTDELRALEELGRTIENATRGAAPHIHGTRR